MPRPLLASLYAGGREIEITQSYNAALADVAKALGLEERP